MIVETGSGSTTANSYSTVVDATDYFTQRNQADAWDAIEDKDAALIMATDYMGQMYRLRWAGIRRTEGQALDWPRYNVPRVDGPGFSEGPSYYPTDQVPEEVKRACRELALRTKDGPLVSDLERAVQSETIGPLTTTYFDADSRNKRYSAVDAILSPLMAGRVLRVSRA